MIENYQQVDIATLLITEPIYLASQSPRRFELLQQMGFEPHLIKGKAVDETPFENEQPVDYVLRLAREKAMAVTFPEQQWPVVTADTAVVCDVETLNSGGEIKQQNQPGEITNYPTILGKPADKTEAIAMLSMLSGSEHRVLTGVCIRFNQTILAKYESTKVRFATLSDRTIAAYVDCGEGMDKAGSYGIQGMAGQFVESITGSYSNVVGLPLCLTRKLYQNVINETSTV